ncbi:MAG TPA: spherulation-specific family 4 protein [Nitrosopumilaceae archaeon]|nr:spherulation-specific family 4 protein [Nitrosopumilaceae archaeon]
MQQKDSRWVTSILVILILVLVPVSQAIPLNINFMQPQTASATGGIALNNTATTGTVPSSPYQKTISSFNAGTGSNRLLVVGVDSHGTDAWVNSITFGGVALTKAVSSFKNNYAAFWYLKNPNGTANIVVTMNAAASVVIGAYAFSGVDQTNPIPTTAANNNTAASSPTISITTANANSWVLDSPSIWGGVTLGSPTCTQRWDTSVQDGIVGKVTGASSSTNPILSGSVTCSWTASSGDLWDDVAVEVKAALGGITLNNTATTGTVPSSSYQKTISSFNAGTGSNRLLVVGVDSHGTDAWVNSITFGGVALTKAVGSFHNNYAAFWYLKNPSGTGNITVTMNAAASVVIGAYAFSGVDQTNPIPTNATNYDTCIPTCTSPSVSITTANANSWVLDSPSIWGGVTLGSPTCTQRWDTSVQDGIVGKVTGASSSKTTTSTGSVTCSWTASPSGDYWDDVAVEIKAASATVPSAPTNVNSTAISTTQLQLKWTAPSNNGGSAITGYQVQRASTTWVNVVNNSGTTITNYNVTSLAANSVYKFRIAAWNSVGLGAYSTNVTGYTLPNAPTSLTANAISSSQINLSWAASGNVTTGYKIERSTNGGSTWSTIVANTGNTNTSYSDTGLAASTTYTYRVSTINAVGTSSPSNTASATTLTSGHNTASAGILMPLYYQPYSGGNPPPCTSLGSFNWAPVMNAKGNHTGVPLTVVFNPNSGPGTSQRCDYVSAITQLHSKGINVLGYVFTQYGSRSVSAVENDIANYTKWYGNIDGILFDEMYSNDCSKTGYYSTLSSFARTNDTNFKITIGNPGKDTFPCYIGTVSNLAIYEDIGLPTNNSTLQGSSNWHTQYDKQNFSFVAKNMLNDGGQTGVQGRSVYVGDMYLVQICSPDYSCISNYLAADMGYLDNPSVLSGIKAQDTSGSTINARILMTQSGNLVRNSTTPFNYNETSAWQFVLSPQTSCPGYTFDHWLDTGSTTQSRTIAPTVNTDYTAIYRTC